MIRPPPSSTLFPYTTLFRSIGGGSRTQDLTRTRASQSRSKTLSRPWSGSSDRKSTRLNSSHLGISYAVFCLKKKIRRDAVKDVLRQDRALGCGEIQRDRRRL